MGWWVQIHGSSVTDKAVFVPPGRGEPGNVQNFRDIVHRRRRKKNSKTYGFIHTALHSQHRNKRKTKETASPFSLFFQFMRMSGKLSNKEQDGRDRTQRPDMGWQEWYHNKVYIRKTKEIHARDSASLQSIGEKNGTKEKQPSNHI